MTQCGDRPGRVFRCTGMRSHIADTLSIHTLRMRGLVAAIVIFVALSAVVRGQPREFVPGPTAPMPAVTVP